MSVDPASASDSASSGFPRSSSDAPALDLDALRVKRRYKKEPGSADVETDDADREILFLSAKLQNLIANKQTVSAPVESEARGAKYHRLSRSGAGVSGNFEGVPASAGPVEPRLAAEGIGTAAAAASVPTGKRAALKAELIPSFVTVEKRNAPQRPWLVITGFLIVGAAGFYAGRTMQPTPEPGAEHPARATAATNVRWTAPMIGQLDKAFLFDHNGDIHAADLQISAIKKEEPAPPGLDLYLPTLQMRQEHGSEAEDDLSHLLTSTSDPLRLAAIQEMLALIAMRDRAFSRAVECYANAATINPFPAELFYEWGEALRHQGHPQDAIAKFKEALIRIPTGQPEVEGLRECTGLKMRLAQIEVGDDSEISRTIENELRVPAPNPYWLLTAAASDLGHGDIPAAAALLAKARDILGTDQFSALLNDYFFRAYTSQRALSAFFPPDAAANARKLLPTMTQTIDP